MKKNLTPDFSDVVLNNKKILVVEDDADMCLGYKVLLQAHGYRTFFASDAVAALSESQSNEPDLIILDLGLPSIDGIDLLRYFGPIYLSEVPVIVVPGRDLQRNEELAFNAGAVAYLQKPWDDDKLLATIARHLSDPGPSKMPPPTAGVLEINLSQAA
jgi:DNA-binding response OmpR family regulator